MAEPKRTPDPRPQKVNMSPAIVERLLGSNDHNRNLRSNAVARWKGIFLRGEYMTGMGEHICISGTLRAPGHVWNGQHRLHGLLDAYEENPDLAVSMWIIDNVPPEAQVIMDTGIKRSLSDVLKLMGETQPNCLAGVIGLSLKIKFGRLVGTGGMFTNNELLDHFNDNPWLREGIHEQRRISKTFPGSPTGIAYAMACAVHVSDDATAEDFTDLVVHGANLTLQHPILLLREQFVEWTRQRPGAGAGPLAHVVAATIINTWNLWRAGEVQVAKSTIRWNGLAFPTAK